MSWSFLYMVSHLFTWPQFASSSLHTAHLLILRCFERLLVAKMEPWNETYYCDISTIFLLGRPLLLWYSSWCCLKTIKTIFAKKAPNVLLYGLHSKTRSVLTSSLSLCKICFHFLLCSTNWIVFYTLLLLNSLFTVISGLLDSNFPIFWIASEKSRSC